LSLHCPEANTSGRFSLRKRLHKCLPFSTISGYPLIYQVRSWIANWSDKVRRYYKPPLRSLHSALTDLDLIKHNLIIDPQTSSVDTASSGGAGFISLLRGGLARRRLHNLPSLLGVTSTKCGNSVLMVGSELSISSGCHVIRSLGNHLAFVIVLSYLSASDASSRVVHVLSYEKLREELMSVQRDGRSSEVTSFGVLC
jgi:hypothetical protein